MSPSTITLLFLLFAVIMFVLEKIPLGVTSMIVCIGLVVTGVLDVKTAFAGFIDSNVILFVAMFIVGGALFETGMANKIGGIVTHFAKTERQLIVAIMVIVGVMSGFLSNTGTAAILIPVVIGIAAKSGYSRSRLLMPLVFAAAMGIMSAICVWIQNSFPFCVQPAGKSQNYFGRCYGIGKKVCLPS